MEPVADRVRVVCVDGRPVVREGVAALLSGDASVELVGQCGTVAAALERVNRLRPDVLVTNTRLADGTALDVIAGACRGEAGPRVVLLTDLSGDVAARRALAAGAQGYVLTTQADQDLISAIHAAMAGHCIVDADVGRQVQWAGSDGDFSHREVQVLRLVAQGLSNKAIGVALTLTEGTVKNYLARLLEKLAARDRTHAVVIALRRGVIELD
jgi:DNA-binding NarL/FixJ family response regulator